MRTIGELRAAIASLPDNMEFVIEGEARREGGDSDTFSVDRAFVASWKDEAGMYLSEQSKLELESEYPKEQFPEVEFTRLDNPVFKIDVTWC